MRVLLGRRLGIPIRQHESEAESGLLVLRNRAGRASKGHKHSLSRLRLLRRQRRTRQRDNSDGPGDEARRKKIRAGGLRWRRSWIHARRREARCQRREPTRARRSLGALEDAPQRIVISVRRRATRILI